MKQKKIGNKLYVFDLEAYQITADTDAAVVYVQNHVYDAFKSLNPSLNIKRYNYNVIGVNKPEWYDYIAQADDNSGNGGQPFEPVNPDPAPVQKQEAGIYFYSPTSSIPHTYNPSNQTSTTYNVQSTLANPNVVGPINYTITSGSEYATLDEMNQLVVNNSLTAGQYPVVVEASFAGNEMYNPATVTHTITINVENYVEPAFTPVTYSFESFDSNNHNIKYGTGKVVTIENQPVPGYVAVQVTENTFDAYVDTPFVGRTFYIDGNAQPADGIYWNLYEYSNSMLEHTTVDVKVYNEDMIPSEAIPSE